MTKIEKSILFLATGAGLGNLPAAPGTFGTLAGIPFILILSWLPDRFDAVYIACLIPAAVWIADRAEAIIRTKDPGCVVIDEAAGYTVAMSVVPLSALSLLLGFVAFRFFDIAKPFPVKWFESNVSGGAGIVLDDIVAGIYSALTLVMLQIFIHF